MRKLLVTGASGFLGSCLALRAVESGWHVTGVMHTQAAGLPGVREFRCDLRDEVASGHMLREVRPDAVVHLAAVAQPNACEADPGASSRLNVDASVHLARVCAASGTAFAFASTDLVFGGRHAPYRETDRVDPINEYGKQKCAAEDAIRDCHPGALVCRLPLMYGEPGPAGGGSVHPLVVSLRQGQRTRLFTDEYRTPARGRDVAQGILAALAAGACGVFHLGGPERVSRYAFGVALARLLGVDAGLVEPALQRDIPMLAARPVDVSLDSSKARAALGYAPAGVEEGLRATLGALSGPNSV